MVTKSASTDVSRLPVLNASNLSQPYLKSNASDKNQRIQQYISSQLKFLSLYAREGRETMAGRTALESTSKYMSKATDAMLGSPLLRARTAAREEVSHGQSSVEIIPNLSMASDESTQHEWDDTPPVSVPLPPKRIQNSQKAPTKSPQKQAEKPKQPEKRRRVSDTENEHAARKFCIPYSSSLFRSESFVIQA